MPQQLNCRRPNPCNYQRGNGSSENPSRKFSSPSFTKLVLKHVNQSPGGRVGIFSIKWNATERPGSGDSFSPSLWIRLFEGIVERLDGFQGFAAQETESSSEHRINGLEMPQ